MSNSTVFVPSLSENQLKIYSTFLDLRKENPIEKITVVNLCKIAGVNRSTFYRSFYDVFDLERKIEDYCAGAVVRFCSSLDFPYLAACAENGRFDKSLFHFEDSIALKGFDVLRASRELYQKVFSRLIKEVPFLKIEKNKNADVLKTVFSFVVTGALLSYRESLSCDGYDASEIIIITFSAFKAFYDKIVNGESFDPLPISEEDPCPVKKKKERLNVKKTKKSLKKAFLELAQKSIGSKISVSELCEKAEISNSTFYLHYDSIDDYTKSLIDEMLESFYELAKSIYAQDGEEKIGIKEMLAYIEKSKSLIGALVATKGIENIYKYPQFFVESFFKIIDKDYECKFDSKTAFFFVCYCGWGSLFEPLDENNISSTYAFKLSYFVFTRLFKRRETPKVSGEENASQEN